ncbi:MAG: DNA polymerase III subunit beta [Candidatus Pacebacteria bacterium]|nr:DNA polymerase III subunit beta [Candidatus Paceibacterota bacterium]MBP9866693.1 DNA polymerase III subunit beta [Candidatus Paceibacterota bacterium]
MKFECKGDVFIKAVQQVSRARSKVMSSNYLQDIHLELDTHLLTLRATNLELFCEKSIPVKGLMNGSCLLQGETLLRIISTFQSKDVTLSCEIIDGVFSITTEKGVIEIKTTPYEDFPTLPKQGITIGTLSKENITMLLREVSFCAATTEIKPEISSVYVYTKDDYIFSVSTDSYRLAEKKIPNDNEIECSLLIPQKHIAEILQIINEETQDLVLSVNESILSISSSNLTLSIHTITGQFPDYTQLFPKEFTTTVEISKEELSKALTLTTFFNEKYSQVECIFTDSKCTLHSKNEAVGQVTHTINATKKGDDIEMKYNNKYFLDVFSHIEGDTLTCMFSTPNRPMFIRGVKDISFTYLLMPLNR